MLTTLIEYIAHRDIIRQFISYTKIGAIAMLVQYIILIVLVQLGDVNAVLASGIGFVLSAFLNYYLNYRYTFRSNKLHREAIFKFFTIASIGLLLNTLILALATEFFSLNYLLSQMIATGIVLIWNFACNRSWTFR